MPFCGRHLMGCSRALKTKGGGGGWQPTLTLRGGDRRTHTWHACNSASDASRCHRQTCREVNPCLQSCEFGQI